MTLYLGAAFFKALASVILILIMICGASVLGWRTETSRYAKPGLAIIAAVSVLLVWYGMYSVMGWFW
jgi:hypothetical protein